MPYPELCFVPVPEAGGTVVELIRQWRNREDIRGQMVNDHIISEAEHRAWVESLRGNDEKCAWVVFADGAPVGLVALSSIDRDRGITDWGIYIGDKAHRGKGIGKLMLYNLMNHVFERLGFNRMKTLVLARNQSAARLYASMGFREVPGSSRSVQRQGRKAVFVEMEIDREAWEKIRETARLPVWVMP